MHIYNPNNKTKYFIAPVLLLALVFLVIIINVGTEPLDTAIMKSNANDKVFFDFGNFFTISRTEFYGKHEGVKSLKQRHKGELPDNMLSTLAYVHKNRTNNIYATARIPYYSEVCKLLSQLIVIYIFMTDGKKRSYVFHTAE